MMDLRSMFSQTDEMTRKARRMGKLPVRMTRALQPIPPLGEYVPDGWYLDGIVLVDKGFEGDKGRSIPPAELVTWANGGAVGIMEEGQFQVVVGRYREGKPPANWAGVERGVGTFQSAADRFTREMRKRYPAD